jgi:hypothetical protein
MLIPRLHTHTLHIRSQERRQANFLSLTSFAKVTLKLRCLHSRLLNPNESEIFELYKQSTRRTFVHFAPMMHHWPRAGRQASQGRVQLMDNPGTAYFPRLEMRDTPSPVVVSHPSFPPCRGAWRAYCTRTVCLLPVCLSGAPNWLGSADLARWAYQPRGKRRAAPQDSASGDSKAPPYSMGSNNSDSEMSALFLVKRLLHITYVSKRGRPPFALFALPRVDHRRASSSRVCRVLESYNSNSSITYTCVWGGGSSRPYEGQCHIEKEARSTATAHGRAEADLLLLMLAAWRTDSTVHSAFHGGAALTRVRAAYRAAKLTARDD